DLPHLAKGERARGHEFHYSEWLTEPEPDGELVRAYAVAGRRGHAATVEGYRWRNVTASYIHLHFASNPILATRWA
ncbi:MAG: cobyrinate a,c-diamide synthase, partial [Nitrospiria bacterium]